MRETSHLEALQTLFASATQEASAAMCRWTSGLIKLSLDEAREIPLADVCQTLELGNTPATMVVLQVEGDLGGHMILFFDEQNGRRLAASLLGGAVEEGAPWTELEMSALTETGNIFACAYMNALSQLLGFDFVPSPPYFLQDYGASVLEQALVAQARTAEEVLVCRTRFHLEEESLKWHVLFVPTDALRSRVERAIRMLD